MYIVHEGEIILKEVYGSSTRERYYIKPPAQENVVVLDEGKSNSFMEWFVYIFLPQGYPGSVSKDYLTYQKWDTAQAFCSTITGILATQEVLRGVGVGDTNATPLAATVTWVMKDGCGHIGRILFAYSHGTCLDAYSKKWRLYADTLNDAAMCLEMALPLFRNYTTAVLCMSTVMKAVVGVAGGATRAALTQHHAIRGNLGDVSAKDSAQETAVNLIASITALLILSIFGNSLFIFIMMVICHLTCNYFAVRSVCLRTLNEPRFLEVIKNYLTQEVILTPCVINKREPLLLFMTQISPDSLLTGFQIKLGYSIQKLVKANPKPLHLSEIKNIYERKKYILYPNIAEKEMFVLVKDDATASDVLHAYFHAVLLSIIISTLNDKPLYVTKVSDPPRPFTEICATLKSADWTREVTEKAGTSGFNYEPSYELLRYVDDVVRKEWRIIESALKKTGWNLTRHLLLVEEWRIQSHNVRQKARQQTTSVSTCTFDNARSELHQEEPCHRETCTIEPDTIATLPGLTLAKSTDGQLETDSTDSKEANAGSVVQTAPK